MPELVGVLGWMTKEFEVGHDAWQQIHKDAVKLLKQKGYKITKDFSHGNIQINALKDNVSIRIRSSSRWSYSTYFRIYTYSRTHYGGFQKHGRTTADKTRLIAKLANVIKTAEEIPKTIKIKKPATESNFKPLDFAPYNIETTKSGSIVRAQHQIAFDFVRVERVVAIDSTGSISGGNIADPNKRPWFLCSGIGQIRATFLSDGENWYPVQYRAGYPILSDRFDRLPYNPNSITTIDQSLIKEGIKKFVNMVMLKQHK